MDESMWVRVLGICLSDYCRCDGDVGGGMGFGGGREDWDGVCGADGRKFKGGGD